MYRGFNLQLNLQRDEGFYNLRKTGLRLHSINVQQVQFTLKSFLNNDSSLNGAAIQEFWFPQIEADVFISHSHQNLDTALVLAGWLWNEFQLVSFIDSCVWGYSEDLLREIDNKYSRRPERGFYDYNLRNHSTSHVHMMLSTSLALMIDKVESLFFLNTPNSVKAYGKVDRTESPWIYSEIAMTRIIEKKEPDRMKIMDHFDEAELGDIEKSLKMTHDIDLSHLTPLDISSLLKWKNHKNQRMHALDILYQLNPPKKKVRPFV